MMSTNRPSRIALAALVAGIFFTAFAASPGLAADDPRAVRTPSVVDLDVQVDGGELFRVTLWEGEMATLRSARHSLTLFLRAGAVEPATGEVSLWVSEPIGANRTGWVSGEASEVRGMVGFRQPLSHFPVDVRVVDARRPSAAETRKERSTKFLDSATMSLEGIIVSGTSCCVTCRGDTLCGCKVVAMCGSCCGGCCGGGIAK